MTIKNREKLLVIAAIGAVAILAADSMILTPLARTWKARTARIVELRNSISKGVRLLDREKAIKMRWEDMKNHALSSDKSVAQNEVVKAVDRWAEDSKIHFTAYAPTWKSSAEDYSTFECRTDAYGTIDELTRFLYDMEKDPLALKIEDLQITSRDTGGQQLSLSVRFSGIRFFPEEK